MKQCLIVEGNDAIVLTNVLMKRKLASPKGYSVPLKYETEFVKKAEGISKVKIALVEELQSPDVTNIGIVVDANDVGADARFQSLKEIIEETLDYTFPQAAALEKSGFTWRISENLFIGIWVMPDNESNGYLEHFVSNLIPEENKIWPFVKKKIDELRSTNFCEFTEIKKQKAAIHTYLAWQASPGLPMGTAIKSNYFDVESPSAESFEAWFKKTFQLEIDK